MNEERDLGESDWEDEDLLTLDEAGERLREEIRIEVCAIEAIDDPSSEGSQRSQRRLDAMRRRVEHIDAELAKGVGTVRRVQG